jgi:hypothetical protein
VNLPEQVVLETSPVVSNLGYSFLPSLLSLRESSRRYHSVTLRETKLRPNDLETTDDETVRAGLELHLCNCTVEEGKKLEFCEQRRFKFSEVKGKAALYRNCPPSGTPSQCTWPDSDRDTRGISGVSRQNLC